MKKIYILQMHTGTIPSKLIKLITRYKYSHICLSLDKECNVLYSFGRKSINNFLDGGFIIEYKNGEFFSKFNNTECRVYELQIDDYKYNMLVTTLNNMIDEIDKYKYDFIGIFFRFFNIPISFKNKYVCSNFIAYILDTCEISKFNKNSILVQPKDFEYLNNITEVYCGKYSLL